MAPLLFFINVLPCCCELVLLLRIITGSSRNNLCDVPIMMDWEDWKEEELGGESHNFYQEIFFSQIMQPCL